jgi:hypothetical protein
MWDMEKVCEALLGDEITILGWGTPRPRDFTLEKVD